MHSIWIVATVAALGACNSELDTSVVVGAGSSYCPGNLCGNSNETAHNGLYKASLFGEPDPFVDGGDLRIQTNSGGRAQIYKQGIAYDLKVDKARVSGVSATDLIEGTQLIGAEIVLERDGEYAYTIDIADVQVRQFPLKPGWFYAYTLTWRGAKQEPTPDQPLCGARQLDVHTKEYYVELLGLDLGETVIYEGEHFNAPELGLLGGYHPDWITFGCAGHALAKMFLLDETSASNPERSWAGSQATLKLLTGNYCGDRNTFTLPGQPLLWLGGALEDYLAGPTTIEARWNEKGATCLGTPRIKYHPSPEAEAQWGPDITTVIAGTCPDLRQCSNVDVADFDGALRISANWDP